jgi:hypothetical protein
MSKAIPIETAVVLKEENVEESSYDLSALLDTLNIFTGGSSSQIQMQVLSSALEELVKLPLPQVIFIKDIGWKAIFIFVFQIAGTCHRIN